MIYRHIILQNFNIKARKNGNNASFRSDLKHRVLKTNNLSIVCIEKRYGEMLMYTWIDDGFLLFPAPLGVYVGFFSLK